MDSPEMYRLESQRQAESKKHTATHELQTEGLTSSRDTRLQISPVVKCNFENLVGHLNEAGGPFNPHVKPYDGKLLNKVSVVQFGGEKLGTVWTTVRDIANLAAAAGRHVGLTGDAKVEEALFELLTSLDKPDAVKVVPKMQRER